MKLRRTILIPLLFIIILFSSLFLIFEKKHLDKEADHNLQRDAQSLSRLIQFQIQTDENIMRTALIAITQDHDVVMALEQSNRAMLETHNSHIFNSLKSQYQISHFYFYTPDLKTIIRFHNLAKSGDVVLRKSLKDAAKFKVVTIGLEQGPTGASVLRVVSPVFSKDKVVGYVELGKEFQDIVINVESILGVKTILLADKNKVDKVDWETRNNTQSFSTKWDFLNNKVVMASSFKKIPDAIKEFDSIGSSRSKPTINYVSDDESFDGKIRLLPIDDGAGKKAGELLLFHDTGHINKEIKLTFQILLAFILTIIPIIGFVFYRFLGRVEYLFSTQQSRLIASRNMATLGEMAAGMSHEINNPLTVIQVLTLSILKNLNSEKPNLERITERIEKIKEKSERIALIIKSLKDFTGENPDKINYEQQNAKEAIETALNLCREKFIQNNVKVNIELGCDVVCYEGNYIDLVKVIYNVLDNAFQAVLNYPGDKFINIYAECNENGFCMRIKNSGPKIQTQHREKIFEPFFTTKEVGEGMGLGLSSALGILKKYRGTIELDKTSDLTSFVIKIPKK